MNPSSDQEFILTRRKEPVGSITIICGSMFSGKTEELIRLVRRAMHARKKVQVFKSSVDTRSETTVIRTHDDIRFNAVTVSDSRALERLLEPETQVIGIEEVQFFDEGVVALCQRLADRGIEVIAAGLDQDFRGLPFGFMPTLLALADSVLKLHAICKICGGEASRTQRLVDGRPAAWDEPTILIGAADSYEARCRRCHKVRKVPRAYRALQTQESASMESPSPAPPLSRPRRPTPSGNGKRADSRNGRMSAVTIGTVCVEDATQLEMFPEINEPPE